MGTFQQTEFYLSLLCSLLRIMIVWYYHISLQIVIFCCQTKSFSTIISLSSGHLFLISTWCFVRSSCCGSSWLISTTCLTTGRAMHIDMRPGTSSHSYSSTKQWVYILGKKISRLNKEYYIGNDNSVLQDFNISQEENIRCCYVK